MPTANNFTALGRGNGFPFCAINVNVSSYDNWVTLGGFGKGDAGSPTSAQIQNSFINAMKLLWNTHDLTATANTGTATGISSTTVTNVVIRETPTDITSNPREPKDRACVSSVKSNVTVDTGGGSFTLGVMNLNVNPVRMYNGATTDIANFVGYGITETASDPIEVRSTGSVLGVGQATNKILIASYLNGTDADTTAANGDRLKRVVSEQSLNSIPFRVVSEAQSGGDAAATKVVTATARANSASVALGLNGAASSSSISTSPFSFYTYS